MNVNDVMAELARLGTSQNRKVYARHGVTEPLFGVSYGQLRPLAKRLGKDHALALALFDTGNHDARILATMVADPEKLTPAEAERFIDACENYVLTDAVAALVARSPVARVVVGAWVKEGREWRTAAGWDLVGAFAAHTDTTDDAWLVPRLNEIEKEIHTAPNRARHSMNAALISIGAYRPALREQALATAARIGPVVVDHGQTGCKTPDAASYIAKVVAGKPDRAGGKKAAKKKAAGKKAAGKKAAGKKAAGKKAAGKKAAGKKAAGKKAAGKKAAGKKNAAGKKKPAKKKPAKKKPAKKKPAKKTTTAKKKPTTAAKKKKKKKTSR